MEGLPLAVLQLIFERVARHDVKNHSVLAIAMTSKRCCAAIDRERFKRVEVVFLNRSQLEESIKRWVEILDRDDRYRHVRHLSIIEKNEPWTFGDAATYKSSFSTSSPEDVQRVFSALAQLTSKCMGLKDLNWESDVFVPAILLSQLQSHTRLHVHSFRLKRVFQHRDKLPRINHEDYALATNPNLHSIRAFESRFNDEDMAIYSWDAFHLWIPGVAPNLRCVEMCRELHGNTTELVQAPQSRPPTWRGPFLDEQFLGSKAMGQLRQLALHGTDRMSQTNLQQWSHATDLSVLTSLTLRSGIDPLAETDLLNMAEQGVFRCLKSFFIYAFGRPKEIHRLIAAFPPLESIAVINDAPEVRESIIACHRETLRELHLTRPFRPNALAWMRRSLPHIRRLNIVIARRNGDQEEVLCYLELGKFTKLQHLTLQMEYNDWCLDDVWFRGKASIIERSRSLRRVLRNIAFDEQLAVEVFQTILKASQAQRPGVISSFEALELRQRVKESDYIRSFENLHGFMARSWILERKYADIHSEDAWICEIDVPARATARENFLGFVKHYGEVSLDSDDEAIFRDAWVAIWPEAKHKDNWIDEWHSFPLWQDVNQSLTELDLSAFYEID